MFKDTEKILTLKLKLKYVTTYKLSTETDIFQLRNKERSLNEQIRALRAEIDLLGEELEVVKNQLSTTNHQNAMIEVCMTSEKTKIATHTGALNQHLSGFQQIFETERKMHELHAREQMDKEAEKTELVRQKQREIIEKNDQITKEAAAVDAETDAIERECAVLKKRNNAIMLKLRKKLLEVESSRRELMKRSATDGVEQHT